MRPLCAVRGRSGSARVGGADEQRPSVRTAERGRERPATGRDLVDDLAALDDPEHPSVDGHADQMAPSASRHMPSTVAPFNLANTRGFESEPSAAMSKA